MVKYFLIYILAGQTSRYHKHQDNPVTQEWCANVRHRCRLHHLWSSTPLPMKLNRRPPQA